MGHKSDDKMRAEMHLVVAEKVGIGRKNRMFTGSQRGGNSMAIAFTLMETAKLNKVDPQGRLTWVLERVADHKINRRDELIPWIYNPEV